MADNNGSPDRTDYGIPDAEREYLDGWSTVDERPARPGFGFAAGGVIGRRMDPNLPVAVDPGCSYRLPASAAAALRPREFLRTINARGGWAPVTKGWLPWMVRRNDKDGTWLVVGPREAVIDVDGKVTGYVGQLAATHAEWRAAFDDAFERAHDDYLDRVFTDPWRMI